MSRWRFFAIAAAAAIALSLPKFPINDKFPTISFLGVLVLIGVMLWAIWRFGRTFQRHEAAEPKSKWLKSPGTGIGPQGAQLFALVLMDAVSAFVRALFGR